METIADRLETIKEKIEEARVKAAGQQVTLVAVSKNYPPEAITEAFDAGQLDFAENRVQEMMSKVSLVSSRIRWHLVGHLQSNKIRRALSVSEIFHGVDSLALAQDIDRVATEVGCRPRVFVEVNVSGEKSKFGFAPDQLAAQWDDILALERIEPIGLMTMAPLDKDPEKSRPYFARLRQVRDDLEQRGGIPLPSLSMGMSGDFAVAIEEGATLVRIGTAIFGKR